MEVEDFQPAAGTLAVINERLERYSEHAPARISAARQGPLGRS